MWSISVTREQIELDDLSGSHADPRDHIHGYQCEIRNHLPLIQYYQPADQNDRVHMEILVIRNPQQASKASRDRDPKPLGVIKVCWMLHWTSVISEQSVNITRAEVRIIPVASRDKMIRRMWSRNSRDIKPILFLLLRTVSIFDGILNDQKLRYVSLSF